MDTSPGFTDMLANIDPEQLATELYDCPEYNSQIVADTEILAEHEIGSAVWKKIRQILIKRLHNYRILNDGALNEVETAKIRGKIEAVLEIMALGEIPRFEEDLEAPDPGY